MVDVILLVVRRGCTLAVVLQVTQRSPALPVISSVAATFAAFLAVVLVVIKVADVPSRYTDSLLRRVDRAGRGGRAAGRRLVGDAGRAPGRGMGRAAA